MHLPVGEMDALRALQSRTGISRTDLVRKACALLFKDYGVEMAELVIEARAKPVPRTEQRREHRHFREFQEMSMEELCQ